MASNLSTIGFVFKDNDEFADKMIELAGQSELHAACPKGHYALWSQPSGAQLWFHIAAEKNGAKGPEHEHDIQGLTPFFEGSSEVRVKITQSIHRSEDNDFEGGFYAWVGPDETGEGAYPMVFDAVDYALHARRPVPFEATIRVSGFARELTAYASEEDYESAAGQEPRLASRAFIPMGLFAASAGDDAANDNGEAGAAPGANTGERSSADGQDDAPSPTALLTGIVSDHHLLTNDETGRDFHWLLVESLDATFDIIADPETIKGPITKGGVVEVACWFFGRFLD